MLVLLFGCEVGCEVLIWGLTWAVFGAILLSDFFLFRSVINEIKVMIAIVDYNVLNYNSKLSFNLENLLHDAYNILNTVIICVTEWNYGKS